MAGAFQANAFQNNAFQVDGGATVVPIPAGRTKQRVRVRSRTASQPRAWAAAILGPQPLAEFVSFRPWPQPVYLDYITGKQPLFAAVHAAANPVAAAGGPALVYLKESGRVAVRLVRSGKVYEELG